MLFSFAQARSFCSACALLDAFFDALRSLLLLAEHFCQYHDCLHKYCYCQGIHRGPYADGTGRLDDFYRGVGDGFACDLLKECEALEYQTRYVLNQEYGEVCPNRLG